MPRNYSAAAREKLNATAADETLLMLAVISHADLPAPIRIVNDNQDILHNGDTFTALAFRVTMPDDLQRGLPRARVAIDNVGKTLTTWLDSSGGGHGATFELIQVLRSAPDVVEWSIIMELTDLNMNMREVSGTLGFNDLLNLPGVPLTYRPDTAPGLF